MINTADNVIRSENGSRCRLVCSIESQKKTGIKHAIRKMRRRDVASACRIYHRRRDAV